MTHIIDKIVFAPDFIEEEILGYRTNKVLDFANKTGVSRNTIKSYDRNKKIPHNTTSKRWISNFVTCFGDMFGSNEELNYHLKNGGLYEHFGQCLMDKKMIVPGFSSLWRDLFMSSEYGRLLTMSLPETTKILLYLEDMKISIHDTYFSIDDINLPGLVFDQDDSQENLIIPYLLCNLYWIASFEIEYFPGEIIRTPETAHYFSEDGIRKQFFDQFLPYLNNGRIIQPLTSWFEAVRGKYNLKFKTNYSWPDIFNDSYLDVEPSLFRKWKVGLHKPKKASLGAFLQCLFPDDKLALDSIFYVIACIFQYMYEELKNINMKENEIIDFFENYINYYNFLYKIHIQQATAYKSDSGLY